MSLKNKALDDQPMYQNCASLHLYKICLGILTNITDSIRHKYKHEQYHSYACYILIGIEFSIRISKKSQITNFKEYPFLAEDVVECRLTDIEIDKQDEADSRLSMFC